MLFYKYREITNIENPNDDYSLHALLNSYAIFSGRKNFDDPLDSKIDFTFPSPQKFRSIRSNIPRTKRQFIDGLVSNGRFTPAGHRFLKTMETQLNNLIDSYPIFSVSSQSDSNLLWAHYASSHKGFCIEFEFEKSEQPEKVIYQQHIASINLLDLIRHNLGLDDSNELGYKIKDALLVKLEEWAYQGEHRWIASNSMGRVSKGEKFMKIQYDHRKVKSIIFGSSMSPEVKEFLIKNIPFATVFKQALKVKDYIEIVDFDDQKHI